MKLLITEPIPSFSCIYLIDETRHLQMIDYHPEHTLMPINTRHDDWGNLPPEIKDMIIEILIDTALEGKHISFAMQYITTNRYHVKHFYTRFFPESTLPTDQPTYACILRVAALLSLFRDTDDWLIDRPKHPVGFYSMNIDLGNVLEHVKPWGYEGDFEIEATSQPTVLFPEHCKNLSMNQILTGPYHCQIVWLGGKVRDGIVDVKYYKNPVIVYNLFDVKDLLEVDVEVSAEFFVTPEWEGFGKLARMIFGHNAGIFFQIASDLPDEFVFSAPVVFEV